MKIQSELNEPLLVRHALILSFKFLMFDNNIKEKGKNRTNDRLSHNIYSDLAKEMQLQVMTFWKVWMKFHKFSSCSQFMCVISFFLVVSWSFFCALFFLPNSIILKFCVELKVVLHFTNVTRNTWHTGETKSRHQLFTKKYFLKSVKMSNWLTKTQPLDNSALFLFVRVHNLALSQAKSLIR